MKRTSELSSKTKAELTAMARRKKIPVTSGMIKDELIKAIKKGLRKIEAQKKSKATTAKTRKRIPVSKATRQTSKKKSSKTSKAKPARKLKSTARKKSPVKKTAKKASAKKPVAHKPKTARSSKKVKIQARPKPVETLSDLPKHYGDHLLVVMARDPNWAYAYWDLNPTKIRSLMKSVGQTADKARWILRVYSAPLRPTEEKGNFFDVDINIQGGNYYLNLSKPGARFIVEIGVMEKSGMFRSTAQSNPVILPLDHPSDTIAPERTFSENRIPPSVTSFTKPPSPRSQ